MLAVKTFDLTKKYGKVTGIENVNLDIEVGEIFGLIGPNGAGKTTFVRLLLNYVFPTSGSAVIFGNDIITEAKENKMTIGYVPAEVECYGNMKAGKYIKTSMKFHKTPMKTEKYAELMELFDVKKGESFDIMDRSDKTAAAIVAALVNDPQLLILDEPSRGLDSAMKNRLFEYLLKKNKEGVTIILTAEQEEDLQGICTHVAYIDKQITDERNTEVHFVPEITEAEMPNEEAWQDQTVAFISTSAEKIQTESEIEDDDLSDSIFNEPLKENISEESLSSVETEIPQGEEGIAEAVPLQGDSEKEIADKTIAIPTIPKHESNMKKSVDKKEDEFIGAPVKHNDNIDVAQRATAAKSIRLKTTKFDPSIFEALGAKIMTSENGKISIAYSGDLEQLAKAIRSMEFNDLTVGDDLVDNLKPLLEKEKNDTAERSVEE